VSKVNGRNVYSAGQQ